MFCHSFAHCCHGKRNRDHRFLQANFPLQGVCGGFYSGSSCLWPPALCVCWQAILHPLRPRMSLSQAAVWLTLIWIMASCFSLPHAIYQKLLTFAYRWTPRIFFILTIWAYFEGLWRCWTCLVLDWDTGLIVHGESTQTHCLEKYNTPFQSCQD